MLLRCPEPGRFQTPGSDQAVDPEVARRQLAAAGDDAALTLVLPATETLFTTLELSRAEQRHLRRLLPWRFEEALIDPVEQMHFAHRQAGATQVHVCAVRADRLEAVLAAAADAGLPVNAVISELELLPWEPGSWTLQAVPGTAGQVMLRTGSHEGLVTTTANLALVLQRLLDETAAMPEHLVVVGEELRPAAIQQFVPPALQELLTPVAAVRPAAAPAGVCNLLQGRFAPALPLRRWWRRWRVAAMLLLALFIADLVLTGIQIYRVEQDTAVIEADIYRQVTDILPGAVIVDPVLQLRRAVSASGGDSQGFLALLQRMAPVLAGMDSLVLDSLEYNHAEAEISMVVVTADFAAVETLRSGLQALGLSADLVGSSSDGQRSRSRLRVRG